MDTTFKEIVAFIRKVYNTEDFIPLHEPRFWGNEKKYLNECIESTFVSSVGKYVDQFEKEIAEYTGSKYAVAVVNGTQALFVGLKLLGAQPGTEVITQALTFIATANSISYTGADPIFLDVDLDTMGLSPKALRAFLETETIIKEKKCWNKNTGKQIVACVPMHTCGFPCRIKEIKEICVEFNLILLEDSAESLGSYANGIHTGRIGNIGILSFNGNKIITTGGGGMIITDDESFALRAKHLTTTAKVQHAWEFSHDEIGYNFRMPNLNAGLGVAQLEQLSGFIEKKRKQADRYQKFFSDQEIDFFSELSGSRANYWMNTILLRNSEERNAFLKYSNENSVMTRCLWTPMHHLPMYKHCLRDKLENTGYLFDRAINIPSSV